jgi:hypothetical protein
MTRVRFSMRTIIFFRTHYLYIHPLASLRIYLLVNLFNYILDLLVSVLTSPARRYIFLYAYLYALHVTAICLLFHQWDVTGLLPVCQELVLSLNQHYLLSQLRLLRLSNHIFEVTYLR